MTCIAGCVDRLGRVWLAGDRAVANKVTIESSSQPKVWRSGGVVLGFAGDWTGLDLASRIDCPAAPDERWVRYGLPSAYRQLRRELGLGDEQFTDVDLLVGACGALWWFGEELAAVRCSTYSAIGSGGDFALGVLYDRRARLGRGALEAAMAAAGAHSTSVCGPFDIVRTG